MKKMTIRKVLENIVAKSHGQDVRKFYLVFTEKTSGDAAGGTERR